MNPLARLQVDVPGAGNLQDTATHVGLQVFKQIILCFNHQLFFIAHLNMQVADGGQVDAGDIADRTILGDYVT